jgi:hypothetical protein
MIIRPILCEAALTTVLHVYQVILPNLRFISHWTLYNLCNNSHEIDQEPNTYAEQATNTPSSSKGGQSVNMKLCFQAGPRLALCGTLSARPR